MKQLTYQQRVEVLPALHGRSAVTPDRACAGVDGRLTFTQRTTRSKRFPLEESLARIPEPPRQGPHLDIKV